MPKLKRILTVISFILPFLLLGQEDAEKIPWGQALQWEDFKAKPDESSPHFASAYSGFSISFSHKVENGKTLLDYEVEANFYPDRSWLKPGKATEKLLRHEQLHFDISELFARKLRKYLSENDLESTKVQREIKRKAQQLERQRKKMENQYDRDTEHGTLPKEQAEWKVKVEKKLKELGEFKTEKN